MMCAAFWIVIIFSSTHLTREMVLVMLIFISINTQFVQHLRGSMWSVCRERTAFQQGPISS